MNHLHRLLQHVLAQQALHKAVDDAVQPSAARFLPLPYS